MQNIAPFEVYRALRLLNPSPYMFFCELGDMTVVGSSPEALVKCHSGQAQLGPSPARGRAATDEVTRSRPGDRIVGRPERKRRARDAGRSRPQRFGTGGTWRVRCASIPIG